MVESRLGSWWQTVLQHESLRVSQHGGETTKRALTSQLIDMILRTKYDHQTVIPPSQPFSPGISPECAGLLHLADHLVLAGLGVGHEEGVAPRPLQVVSHAGPVI